MLQLLFDSSLGFNGCLHCLQRAAAALAQHRPRDAQRRPAVATMAGGPYTAVSVEAALTASRDRTNLYSCTC